jgi:hypothetical protein
MSTQGKCILCDAISHRVDTCPSLQIARAAISLMKVSESVDIQYLNEPAGGNLYNIVIKQGKHGNWEVYSQSEGGVLIEILHRGTDQHLKFSGSVRITVEYGLAEVPSVDHPEIIGAHHAARIIELDEDDLSTTVYVEMAIPPTYTMGDKRVTGFQPFNRDFQSFKQRE